MSEANRRVLGGLRVLVTRPRQQAAGLAGRLAESGAEVVCFAAIQIVPVADPTALDQALDAMAGFDWVVFTSANGVELTCQRMAASGLNTDLLRQARLAAVGPVTARALTERGLAVDFMPAQYVAEAIAEGLGEVRGLHFLLLSAEEAREELAERLQQRGARVTRVAVYRTLPAEPDEATLAELVRGVDVVTLASASAARSFASAAAGRDWPWLASATIACFGPVTAQAALACGLPVHIVAGESTADGLVEALQGYFQTTKDI